MKELLKIKLEDLVIKTLGNIRKYSNILQRLKFYEQVYSNLVCNTVKNKREIYYNSVSIFKNQNIVDRLIKETCNKLKCTQSDLLISTTLKGIFNGALIFCKKSDKFTLGGTSLIPDMTYIDKVICNYKKCLVIEKDTIFSKIVREYKNEDILFVCGKGYPCRNTVSLIKMLDNIEIWGMFDFDPYGLEISTKYPKIRLIKFDINLIDQDYYLALTNNDLKKAKILQNKGRYMSELKYMIENNIKVELEGLFHSKNFNIEKYLQDNTIIN